jgi:hypothetical protein
VQPSRLRCIQLAPEGDSNPLHYVVSIAIRDELGALARVTRHLASWQINLDGLVANPAGLRLVVEKPDAIVEALDAGGLLYRIEEVQEIVLPDRPGALAELCHRLADRGINILHAFGVSATKRGHVFLAVDDWDRAAPILDLYTNGPPVVHPRLGRIQ